jgi:hypothetical protein
MIGSNRIGICLYRILDYSFSQVWSKCGYILDPGFELEAVRFRTGNKIVG